MWNGRVCSPPVIALYCAVSCAAGASTAYLLTKKAMMRTYESLISEEVAKAKAFYSQRNKTGEFSDPVSLAERLVGDEEEDPFANEPDDDYIVVDGKPFRETMDPEDRVNYNKFSKKYTGPIVKQEEQVQKPLEHREGETMAEYEQRVIDDANARVQEIKDKVAAEDPVYAAEMEEEEPVVSNIFDTNSVDAIKVSREGSTRDTGRPYIISVTEFTDNELGYGQNAISFYAGDNVLADERDQPIPDIDYVIGRKNLRFGDGSGDPNVVFVRNEQLEVDFEICQSLGTYAEEVLGVAPQDSRSQRPH